MRLIVSLVLIAVCMALASCGPKNSDLHPLPTFRVHINSVSVPAPAPGGSEVTLSAVWETGGPPFLVTWAFPPEFERVLVSEETSQRQSTVRIRLPAGAEAAQFVGNVTVADGSPYRDTRSFTLQRSAAPAQP
ncbi:hypothetical protein IT575_03505 [bacterium]|nr:hypothetical protein [bacterium]